LSYPLAFELATHQDGQRLDAIVRELATHAGRARPTGFKIDLHRTTPRNVRRAGTDAIEAIFGFETAEGRGSGVLRLTLDADDGGTFKAWTLLTALDEIKGHEERLGRSRPQGKAYSRDFRGPNWLDLRKAAAEYDDRDPTVLVVGGGQAGLSIAARLAQLGVDTLIVDREARIGDNWHKLSRIRSAQRCLHRARLVQNGPRCTGGGPRIGRKAKREGAAPRPSPYIKKLERVQMPNALYRRTADRLRPSGCYGSSAGTSGCAGSSP
jgi:hypothetical protein